MTEPKAEAREPRWNAGAVGWIPEDDSLVWRDDAVYGLAFYARSPSEAVSACTVLNAMQRRLDALETLIVDTANEISNRGYATPTRAQIAIVERIRRGMSARP